MAGEAKKKINEELKIQIKTKSEIHSEWENDGNVMHINFSIAEQSSCNWCFSQTSKYKLSCSLFKKEEKCSSSCVNYSHQNVKMIFHRTLPVWVELCTNEKSILHKKSLSELKSFTWVWLFSVGWLTVHFITVKVQIQYINTFSHQRFRIEKTLKERFLPDFDYQWNNCSFS